MDSRQLTKSLPVRCIGEKMGETGNVSCVLCGRCLLEVHQGRVVRRSGKGAIVRKGKQFRCGYCRGTLLFEPDPTASSFIPTDGSPRNRSAKRAAGIVDESP